MLPDPTRFFTPAYDRAPEMWQNSIGKTCIFYVQNLKEAIPPTRNRFR